MKRILLLTATFGLLYLTLSSNSIGPAAMGLNASGSPGSGGSCGSCHGGGPGTTTATLEVRKLSAGPNGPIVTQYLPDTNYIVKITGNHPTLTHFGFQLTAFNSSNANAGVFSTLPGNIHTASTGGKTIVEHSTQLPKTNNQFEATLHWKAPPSGTGTVTFYGIINAVNNNNQVGGDKPSPGFNLALSEVSPTDVNDVFTPPMILVYPNPVSTQLAISLGNAANGVYTIDVLDIQGRVVTSQSLSIDNSFTSSINTTSWGEGLYIVQLRKGSLKTTTVIQKQ